VDTVSSSPAPALEGPGLQMQKWKGQQQAKSAQMYNGFPCLLASPLPSWLVCKHLKLKCVSNPREGKNTQAVQEKLH